MSKAIDGVKTDTSRIFEKLDLALMTSRAQGQITLRVVSDALQVCVYGTVLIAAVVSGIVYIATNATSQETAVLSYKVERLVGSFGWRPEVRREAERPPRP